MKLSIVIPCYNESKNIPLILESFNSVIKRDDIEVLLVNNGSTDDSSSVLADLLPKYVFAKAVHVEQNQGYGFGILSGLREAKGQYIGWTHADMQTDPHDPVKALDIIESKGDPENIYVKGRRKGRPFFDTIFTDVMGVFETIYFGTVLWDINAQPNIFHRSFFERWTNPPYDFSFDLYSLYMAKINKLDLVHFDVLFTERIHGQSNWNTSFAAKWKFIKRTFEYSFKLKREMRLG